jgi:broad specificity polyphosphatase/5'/3'-nucleotidase SurE
VTWIDFDNRGYEAQRILSGTGAGYVNARMTGVDATSLSQNIGKVAAQALTGTAKASAR